MRQIMSVIVPTTASRERVPLLRRALLSLQEHQDEAVLPVVVVNGCRYVPEVLDSLSRQSGLRCLYLDKGSHIEARLAGRRAVETEFFGFLDDDDEYLPGAAQCQLSVATSERSIDAVITNGFWHESGQDTKQFADLASFEHHPLESLMDWPWLHGGGAMFRTDRISADYLETPPCMELTYIALKLSLTRRLRFLDVPTYRYHRQTPESLSRMKEYLVGEPEAIREMLKLDPPPHIKRRLKRKHVASLHRLSNSERRDGRYGAAWRYHLRSVLSPYGIRYWPYTRHLLVGVNLGR